MFGNARFARNLLEAAIGKHAWRLREIAEPTVEQLRQLIADDFDEGVTENEPPTTADERSTAPVDLRSSTSSEHSSAENAAEVKEPNSEPG
jgi:hypothetical protein